MSVDLSTELAGVRLTGPLLPASGCAGTGRELEPFAPVRDLGGFVTRTVTLDPRPGRPGARVVETPSGVLHAAGLANPGLHGFLATELPWLVQQGVRVFVSVWAAALAEYAELAGRLSTSPGVAGIEVNLAGDHEDRSRRAPAVDPYQAGRVLAAVRQEVPSGMPVLAKLVPDAALVDVAAGCVDAGADGLVVAHGPPGLALDPDSLRPVPVPAGGSLGGPAVRAVALRSVWEVHHALPAVPLVGVGGVRSGLDVIALLAAGARAVQLGTVLLHDPSAPVRILEELRAELLARDLSGIADAVGLAHLEREPS